MSCTDRYKKYQAFFALPTGVVGWPCMPMGAGKSPEELGHMVQLQAIYLHLFELFKKHGYELVLHERDGITHFSVGGVSWAVKPDVAFGRYQLGKRERTFAAYSLYRFLYMDFIKKVMIPYQMEVYSDGENINALLSGLGFGNYWEGSTDLIIESPTSTYRYDSSDYSISVKKGDRWERVTGWAGDRPSALRTLLFNLYKDRDAEQLNVDFLTPWDE